MSVLERPYGEITIVRGLDERGNELAELSLQAARPRPAKIERALLWQYVQKNNRLPACNKK